MGHMIDLHSHLLPGIDDGAADLAMAHEMARAFIDQGVEIVACTPHILPGVYHNTGDKIRRAIAGLQASLDDAGLNLRLTTGADNHVIPNFVEGLKAGHLLTLGDTRYVLVEPPHHVAPTHLDRLFFDILVAGYVPILTHPERLSWIESKYATIRELASRGVWMQITAGSLRGRFGSRARYWGERMLNEGLVHILATDAHDPVRRRPDLAEGRELAAKRLGSQEAEHLVATRPRGILANELPRSLPAPCGAAADLGTGDTNESFQHFDVGREHGFTDRLRRLFHL